MNCYLTHFVPSARFGSTVFLLILLGCFNINTGSFAMAQDAPKMFRGHDRVCLLEVTKADGVKNANKYECVKQYRVSVKVVDQHPPGKPHDSQILVSHTDWEKQIWKSDNSEQDWFPIETGKRVVVAFNGNDIPPTGKLLIPLDADANYTVDAVWHNCTTFYEAVNRPRADQAAEVTKRLREHKQRLGPHFFHLIDNYDQRHIVDDKQFSLAAAEYLSNVDVPLKARLEIVNALRGRERDDSANRELVASMVRLVREAKKSRLPPRGAGNLLMSLSRSFVTNKSRAALPDIEPPVRQELLELARDKEAVTDFRDVVPLINWLEGKEPGDIPRSLDGKPPREEEMRPVPPVPPVPPKEIPPKIEVASVEGPLPADRGGVRWKTVFKAVCVVISSLALLMLFVHYRRGRRAP